MDIQGWYGSNFEDNTKILGLGSFLSSVMILDVENMSITDQYLNDFLFNAKIIYERINEEPFQKLVIFCRDWITNEKDGFAFSKELVGMVMETELKQNIQGQKLLELVHSSYDNVSVSLSICLVDDMNEKFYTSKLGVLSSEIVLKKYQDKILSGGELVSLAKKWTQDINSYLVSGELYYYLAYKSSLDNFDEKIRKAILEADCLDKNQQLIIYLR